MSNRNLEPVELSFGQGISHSRQRACTRHIFFIPFANCQQIHELASNLWGDGQQLRMSRKTSATYRLLRAHWNAQTIGCCLANCTPCKSA